MILLNDLSSLVESMYTGQELSYSIKSDTVVNPNNNDIRGKTVIINYLYDNINLEKLSNNNSIISRIPLKINNYKLEPYDTELLDRINISIGTEYKILSPYFFNRPIKSTKLLELPNFVLSTNLSNDGYLNIAGLIQKKLPSCENSLKNLKKVHDVYRKHLSMINLNDTRMKFTQFNYLDVPTIDLVSNDNCFIGPSVVNRSPNKRMNVKRGYTVSKFKTYRITDAHRSYNIRFNTTDGFYLFESLNSEPNSKCLNDLESSDGFEICIYLLYYFCKKNHFKVIKGDLLFEPLQGLIDPDGLMELNISLYPPEVIYVPEVFNLALLGNNLTKFRKRDYITF